jgi:hypothetical protein
VRVAVHFRQIEHPAQCSLPVRYRFDEDMRTIFTLPEYYNTVTMATIHEAAKQYLAPADVVTVKLFPASGEQRARDRPSPTPESRRFCRDPAGDRDKNGRGPQGHGARRTCASGR